jgi:hypothetical protein
VKRFLEGINTEQEKKIREKFQFDEKYRIKFTLKMLLLLDRISDLEKATILSKIVVSFVEDQIDKVTMERLSDAVDRLFLQDVQVLRDFYNYQGKSTDFIYQHYESLQNLAMSGLVALGLQDGSGFIAQWDMFNPNESGEKLVTILQDGVPPVRRFRLPDRHKQF